MAKIKITQVRSKIGANPNQRRNMRTLGLSGLHKSVIKEDTPQVLGVINKVRHLVEVEKV